MRIACVGAGPAGLLLALLLRRDGRPHVDVYERSPADTAYGFGVVFSRLGLARIRAAAPDVVDALVAEGARWDDIEVRRDGQVVRSSGHGFAAVERRALLRILSSRAAQAGAVLRYQTEVTVPDLLDRYDLVVAGDGAGSRTRAALADQLGVQVDPGESRYVWFGVDRPFDAMTFLFADAGHGTLGAHVYPYSAGASTFLVEAGEQTWQRAGFTDGAEHPPGWTDQDALAYCTAAFGADLAGARLLANGSRWLRFHQLSLDRWSAGRLVLIGDAAHTAHFSVGSGTTMAMEDAVELARRLRTVGAAPDDDELRPALDGFEQARRPSVANVQRSAWASRRMWSHPEEHRDLDAGQLMLRMLTRTAQSTLGVLLRIDPDLPRRLGRPVSPTPTSEPVRLVRPGDSAPAQGPTALLLRVDQVERACADGAADLRDRYAVLVPAEPAVGEALCRLRATVPDVPLGVLLAAGVPAEEPVGRLVAEATTLAGTGAVDIVVVGPGTGSLNDSRAAQLSLCERLRAGHRLRTGYACPASELDVGWTQVQAQRADEVWLLPPPDRERTGAE